MHWSKKKKYGVLIILKTKMFLSQNLEKKLKTLKLQLIIGIAALSLYKVGPYKSNHW